MYHHLITVSLVFIYIIYIILHSCVCEENIFHPDSFDVGEDAEEKLSLYLENNSIESLPIHSREVRPASCAEGVEEEVILYR